MHYDLHEQIDGKVEVRSYEGFDSWPTNQLPVGSADLVICTFEGEPELWAIDPDSSVWEKELRRKYQDDYDRQPEDMERFVLYEALHSARKTELYKWRNS